MIGRRADRKDGCRLPSARAPDGPHGFRCAQPIVRACWTAILTCPCCTISWARPVSFATPWVKVSQFRLVVLLNGEPHAIIEFVAF
jgi:hypothetical protein